MSAWRDEYERSMAETYRKVAKDVVDDLRLVLAEPPIDTQPVSLDAYPHLDRRWYEETTRTLESLGFRHLRDVDAAPLAGKGMRPCIRVMLAADGRTTAGLYQLVPRAPNILARVWLSLTGKWPGKPCIIELLSYFPGGAYSTSSQGELNHFQLAPGSSRRLLPLGTAAATLVEAHHAHVVPVVDRLVTFEDFEAVNQAREAQRLHSHRWRAEVGLLDTELDHLLAPHGATGEKLRPYILAELAARRGG